MIDESDIIRIILNELHSYDKLMLTSPNKENGTPENERQNCSRFIYRLAQEMIQNYDLVQSNLEPIKASIRCLLVSKLSKVNIIPEMPEVLGQIQQTLIGSQAASGLPADIWLLRCVYATLLTLRITNESMTISPLTSAILKEKLIWNAKTALLVGSRGNRKDLDVYRKYLPFLHYCIFRTCP